MTKKIYLLFVVVLIFNSAMGQISEENSLFTPEPMRTASPFLFSETTLTAQDQAWTLNYSSSYGQRVEGPFGYDGIGQQFALKGYLGSKFTVYANASFGVANEGGDVMSAQQAEVIRDFIGGNKPTGFRLGLGLGINRDYSDVKSLLSRVTLSFDQFRWKAGGNVLFEKALAGDRDKIDVISSFGFHHELFKNLYGGLEAVGEDLEGLWDDEEAEGGAKVFIGPSLNLAPSASRFSFSLSGGPVFYASRNQATNFEAVRELPSQTGLTIRAKITFDISGT